MKLSLSLLAMTLALAACSAPPQRVLMGSKSGSGDSGRGDNKPVTDKPVSGKPGDGNFDDNGNPVDDDGNIIEGEDGIPLASTAFPRISHLQWENSVKDLLLLNAVPGLSKDFEADPPGSIFNNDGSLLKVSPNLWSDYRIAAEKLADTVVSNATQLQKLIPPSAPASGVARAKAILEPLMKRAYRRPPTAAELDALAAIYEKGRELTGETDATKAGMRMALTALLQAPRFIYRIELGENNSGITVQLGAYELASRLSFALWNTIPDETLLTLAESQELLKEEVLSVQVDRLMKDSRARSTLSFFNEKTFRIDSFVNISKNAQTFPQWSSDMGEVLRQEASAFINDVVNTQSKGLTELLTAPYTFVNSKNAPLYGLTSSSATLTKTNLDPKQRAGLLTQAGFLAYNATATETDPIHRGVSASVNVLCANLIPPAGNIPALPNETVGKTMRERVEAHTGKGTCGGTCHGNMINPAGYAFENFDAIGRWRTMDNGQAVDAASEYTFANGTLPFDGPVAFMKGISARLEAHRCYVGKAVELLYGRRKDGGDNRLIERLAKESLGGLSTKQLFIELLKDPKLSQRTSEGE